MIKKIWIFLILAALTVPMRVFAAEESCSIRLTMHCGSNPVPGGTVTLYCITGWADTADPEKLSEAVAARGLYGTTGQVSEGGCLEYQDLEPGQYLLVQSKAAEGYQSMKPFCVSVPMSIGGKLIYHIDAKPKLEPVPGEKLPQTGQLIWPVWLLLGTGTFLVGIGLLTGKRR